MIKQIDITNPKLAQEILTVQIPSYLVEAELINFHDIPPLNDTVQSLQQCGETFFGYYLNNELCGAISMMMENEVIDIHRLMVHPEHFRKGIARKLLNFIEEIEQNCTSIIVSTGSGNTPAVHFYLTSGFIITGEKIVQGGLSLTSFSKNIR
ncbi:GNAT family N-acetyltransferase [Sporosarcina sp. FSL K6-1508]|uniref:GNAT family N-acetyltransferase n=1 Tax=Sporosarcina sp. FSL K6-1508 TaxID=2921553 RepID=UPI0030FA98AC